MSRLTTHRLSAAVYLLIAFFVGLVAALRVRPSVYAWPEITTHGLTRVASDAALLLTPRHRALIWEAANNDAPLVYQPPDGITEPLALLPYNDLMPETWHAIPARADAYHVVWLEPDDRLRSAFVHRSGRTLLGPVEHAPRIAGDITVTAGADGHAFIYWLTAPGDQIASLELDSEGRPGPVTTYPPRNVRHIAAARSVDNVQHVAWLETSPPGTWTVNYSSSANLTSHSTSLHTFTLEPATSITSVDIGLDRTTGYVIIGTNTAAQPDLENVRIITFERAKPPQVRITQLVLPQTLGTIINAPANELHTGQVAALASKQSPNAPLRWPRVVTGEHKVFALTLALQSADGWRPAVVYFADGAPLGYQIIADRAADAAPATGSIAPDGNVYVTWAGLSHGHAQRYTASTGSVGWSATTQAADRSPTNMIAGIALGFVLSAAWIAAPLPILLLPPTGWTPLLLYTVYNLVKLIWPPDLFTRLPPLIAVSPLQHLDAAVVVGTTAALITLLALGCAAAVNRVQRVPWHQWLVFIAVDVSLTLLVFGPNLAIK